MHNWIHTIKYNTWPSKQPFECFFSDGILLCSPPILISLKLLKGLLIFITKFLFLFCLVFVYNQLLKVWNCSSCTSEIAGDIKQNLHWKLGQQTPSAGTLLAYLFRDNSLNYIIFRNKTFFVFQDRNLKFLASF